MIRETGKWARYVLMAGKTGLENLSFPFDVMVSFFFFSSGGFFIINLSDARLPRAG